MLYSFVRWRVSETDLTMDAVFAVKEAKFGQRLVPYSISISHNGKYYSFQCIRNLSDGIFCGTKSPLFKKYFFIQAGSFFGSFSGDLISKRIGGKEEEEEKSIK